MKVICKEIDPDRFPVSELHRAYFRSVLGAGKKPRIYDWLRVGQEYIVYALRISGGYPFYYVNCTRPPCPWFFEPSMCFDIIDPRPSALWRYQARIFHPPSGDEVFISTFAIKEWIETPGFFERLVDLKEPELTIMNNAAAAMDREFV